MKLDFRFRDSLEWTVQLRLLLVIWGFRLAFKVEGAGSKALKGEYKDWD